MLTAVFIAGILLVLSICSFRTSTSIHNLKRETEELFVVGVRISPKFRSSSTNFLSTAWGPPWQLTVVSEASRDAISLQIHSASLAIGGRTFSIVDRQQPWRQAYAQNRSGEHYINASVGEVVATPIATGEKGTLRIDGEIVAKEGSQSFSHAWAIESELTEGEMPIKEFFVD